MKEELFFISVASEMLGMHPQTLRKYERLGLIRPSRTIGSMRLYSRGEIEKLRAHQAPGRGDMASTWQAYSVYC